MLQTIQGIDRNGKIELAEINRQISEQVRLADEREATPSLASLDSQKTCWETKAMFRADFALSICF